MSCERIFLCKAGDILAAIGPSLGPCCAEFKGYKDIFPRFFADFMTSTNHFDLWAISVHQMTEAGLCPENIHVFEDLYQMQCRPFLLLP